MAIPINSVRVELVGTVSDDSEIFNTGFWLGGPSISTQAETQSLADDLAGMFDSTMGITMRPLNGADTAFQEVRVYTYQSGGTAAEFVAASPVTVLAGTGTNPNPLQCAIVATLETGAAGRRNRGRMYLPANAAGMNADHHFTTAVVDAVCNSLTGFFNAINAGYDNPVVVVMSNAASASRAVTAIQVDDKPDTQRRRANRQPRTYLKIDALT